MRRSRSTARSSAPAIAETAPARRWHWSSPLDAKGVSRGKPLDKIGQRALPQGELFFDQVSISTDWLIAPVEDYQKVAYAQLAEANAGMGAGFVGVARAAFELALDYAEERVQGGIPIGRHQHVRYRLFQMVSPGRGGPRAGASRRGVQRRGTAAGAARIGREQDHQ